MKPGAECGASSSAGTPANAPGWFRSPWVWVLVACFAFEFLLFDQAGARQHTRTYPRWNDQIQYLTESYTAYENARRDGFLPAWGQTLTNRSAQGTLHDFFALIAFTFTGPSRSAALVLNLLALMAWQVALYVGVLRTGRSGALALAAALLPAILFGPWANAPGSANDFRLDHFALCAMGVTSVLAWQADGFRSRRISLLFGAAVAVTMVTRFLTGTYFAVFFGAATLGLLIGSDRKTRAINLGLAAAAAFALAAPFYWINRETVLEYYWIGHFVGPESAIRNASMGVAASLSFLWHHLLHDQMGYYFVGVALIGAAALACGRSEAPTPVVRGSWTTGALFLCAPALVLALHRQKSVAVLGVLLPGLVLLVIGLWQWAARRNRASFTRGVATALVLASLAIFTHYQTRLVHSPPVLADLRKVNSVADEISRRARAAGLKELVVAADYITDALDAQVLRVVCYERQRILWPVNMTLPTGIAEPSEELVMQRLAQSDFVFVTADDSTGPFPFDRKLAQMRPRVRTWCDQHLRAVNQFTLLGRRMILYQRREIPFP